jgi:Ferritin-like
MNPKTQLARNIAPVLNWARNNRPRALHGRSEPELSGYAAVGDLSFKSVAHGTGSETPFELPPEFTGKDYLTMLLHIDAEIEHGLMLQYLYAAYSLGGPQIPEQYRATVKQWQDIILGIAKEEMGHFISVQNVLKLMGVPLNFGRESYPWDTPFYPFPFYLEPLTLDSLAKYVYAEAPAGWLDGKDPLAAEIKKRVHATVSDPHTVGALFKIILSLVKDPQYMPDDVFQPGTYPFQAKFDEWGRGYSGGQRGNAHTAGFDKSPDVLVVPLTCRDDAYNALYEIAEQGEGEDKSEDTLPSHFERFLHIYKEWTKIPKNVKEPWSPARNIAMNPYVAPATGGDTGSNDPDGSDPADGMTTDEDSDAITHPETRLWGNLFNIRYRMLLDYLNHSFLLDNGYNQSGAHAPRGLIINSTFGEMYNLRSIASAMVQMPLSKKNNKKMAGPPFTIPYTLDLPFGEANRWRLHSDLLLEARNIITELLAVKGQLYASYLDSLLELDNKMLETIESLLNKNCFV